MLNVYVNVYRYVHCGTLIVFRLEIDKINSLLKICYIHLVTDFQASGTESCQSK